MGGGGGGSNLQLEYSIRAEVLPMPASFLARYTIDGPALNFFNEFAFETRTGLLLASLAELRRHARNVR
jgi:hypothetical protein